MATLRRWTVLVLLALLVLVTVVEIVDGLVFGDRFRTDPAFYTLVGGMIAGLFVAEGVNLFRRHDGHDR